MTRITAIALLALFGSVAAADDLDKALSQLVECNRQEAMTPYPKQREPGLLKLEDIGLCQDQAQRTPMPWEHCGDCGTMQRWDDRLQIWRPPGR